MKKYNKPELKLSIFMNENVLTGSGVGTALDAWKEQNTGALTGAVDFREINSVLVF